MPPSNLQRHQACIRYMYRQQDISTWPEKKNKMSKKGRVAVVGLFYVKTANTLQDTG